ncbi:isochorismatase family cysteine hydrolase [Lactobacillus sp. YT155]|uniref:cysteine hydrolase family protein n=1 Tax=Lactobacillus sp. YT155 TaxID=3060955 RepID=UPI00265FB4AD|nr:isochorismatase family cysteine hydrolase [Lactobacillus sp. YT155]MDO1604656.1 isochorismatase family cysteine hydrolase [Lactobacillus sp. YT155]
MDANKEALLIIDYTNDFVADDGALTCGKPGQEIEDYIVNLADNMKENAFIYLPTDIHVKDDPFHPETKLFPIHNQENTWGRELYGKLAPWYQANKSNTVQLMDKTRYSSFAGTNLDILLRERHVDTVHLVGVCSDICVLHTAVDAYNLGYKIVIHEKGIATFTDNGQEWSLNHFKNSLGATIKE